MKTLKILVTNFPIVSLLFGPTIYAADCASFNDCTNITDPQVRPPGFGDTTFVGDLITKFLPIILGIGGFIAVIMIIISGIELTMSGGNPDGANAAKNRLIYSLVGFVLIVLAYAVTKFIDNVFLNSSGAI